MFIPLFKPPKIQTICVFSDFQKITMFLQISLILSFFAKVYLAKSFKIVHLRKFISQSFSYFSLSIFCMIKPMLPRNLNLKNFSEISWFAKVYLAKYFTLLSSRRIIQKIRFSPLMKVSLIKVTWNWKNKFCENLCSSCFWLHFQISSKIHNAAISKYLGIHKAFITI